MIYLLFAFFISFSMEERINIPEQDVFYDAQDLDNELAGITIAFFFKDLSPSIVSDIKPRIIQKIHETKYSPDNRRKKALVELKGLYRSLKESQGPATARIDPEAVHKNHSYLRGYIASMVSTSLEDIFREKEKERELKDRKIKQKDRQAKMALVAAIVGPLISAGATYLFSHVV